VDLDVQWGEVHALLGENGAGKSTLMNIVYGLVRPDSGTIEFDGKAVQVHSPTDAIRLGIGMVHQHFMLIPVLTVAENIVLGHEIQNAGVMDLGRAYKTVLELSERYGLQVDPRARVSDLSVGIQQRVEILKALYRGARLLILDERDAYEIRDRAAIAMQMHEYAQAIDFFERYLELTPHAEDRTRVGEQIAYLRAWLDQN